MHNKLGSDAVDVSALVRNHSVGPAGQRAFPRTAMIECDVQLGILY